MWRISTYARDFVAAFFMCFVVWMAANDVAAQPQPEVFAIRFGTQGDTTRIVLDIDNKVEFQAATLDTPSRLVVDLPRLRWRLRSSPLDEPQGLAVSRRYGRLDHHRDQLIVDLNQTASITSAILLPPSQDVSYYRLVLDVRPAMAAATEAAANRKPQPAAAQFAPKPRQPTIAKPRPRPEISTQLASPVPTARPDHGLTAKPGDKRMIVLDPGHGGVDPGAIGVNGIYEKDIVLSMAEELAKLLRATGRYEVELTRHNDVFLPLSQRMALSRKTEADLFISIHADSIGREDVRGASVYTLSEKASDGEAAKLARKENKADILGGVDLSTRDETVARILIDLAQRDTNNKSIEFANKLINELAASTKVLKRTRRFAGFVVLKSPDTPSVLLELGYLSNPNDAQNLVRPEHRAEVGRAIVRAIDRYFDQVKHALMTE